MYPRVKRVRRGAQLHEYVQLVEGHRVDGKVRQRVVATLGRLDELKATGQLDRWAGAFARLDPPPVGTRREVGPLLLVTHYLCRLGLTELVDAAAPMRGRSLLTHGEVISALVANRLSCPAPLYDVAGWASGAALAELLGVPAGLLNDDRLGRALEAFATVADDVRGRVLLTTLDRFDVDATRLHLDLTTLRFTGAYPDSTLVAKGWGSDRKVARQVRALQASTPTGVPLLFRPHCRPAWSWSPTPRSGTWAACAQPTAKDCGSSSRCAPTPAGPSTSTPRSVTSPTSPTSTTPPNANATYQPSNAPAGAAPCTRSRSPTPRPKPTTTCGWPTSGPRRKPPPSAMPVNVP